MRSTLVNTAFALLLLLMLAIAGALFLFHVSPAGEKEEVLPFSGFVVLLSYGAFAMNWARLTGDMEKAGHLRTVYVSALWLFLASLMTLFTLILMWLPQASSFGKGPDQFIAYLHIATFGFTLIFALIGCGLMLNVIRHRLLEH